MMDFKALGQRASETDATERKIDENCHLQADCDFFCYEVCDLEKSLQQNWTELKNQLEYKRKLAGCGVINVHVTLGLKGGRNEMATVKPYQEKRDDRRDPAIKERVRELRTLLANYKNERTNPVPWVLQEADDGMVQYQVDRIATHGVSSTMIMSSDKDLWMAGGRHVDPKTGRVYTVDGYGGVAYKDVGNVSLKLIGTGTCWFWHQMIMGDPVDNIPGLPMLSGHLANLYLPTKKYDAKRKPLACGEAKAVAVLEGAGNNIEAARRVYEAYSAHYGADAMEMFIEQAFLLWMRRTARLADCLTFLRECNIIAVFSAAQKLRLQQYQLKAKAMLAAGDV
jgi:hypothetical protein